MQQIKKLIPLSEFVSKIDEICPIESHEMDYDHDQRKLATIIKYNNFLQQPLELSMFVPLGYNGEVLEEPYNDGYEDYETRCLEYHTAKERCLFKGFEWKEPCELYRGGKLIWYGALKGNIQDLESLKPTLTPTALKQIY